MAFMSKTSNATASLQQNSTLPAKRKCTDPKWAAVLGTAFVLHVVGCCLCIEGPSSRALQEGSIEQARRLYEEERSVFGQYLWKPSSVSETEHAGSDEAGSDETASKSEDLGLNRNYALDARVSWNLGIFNRAVIQMYVVGFAAAVLSPYCAYSLLLFGANICVCALTHNFWALESWRQISLSIWGIVGLTLTGVGGAWWSYGLTVQVCIPLAAVALVVIRLILPIWRWRNGATVFEALSLQADIMKGQLARTAPAMYVVKWQFILHIICFVVGLVFCPLVVLSYLAVDVAYESRGYVAFAIFSPIVALAIAFSKVCFNVSFAAVSVFCGVDQPGATQQTMAAAALGVGTSTKFAVYDGSRLAGLLDFLFGTKCTNQVDSWMACFYAAIRGIGFTNAFRVSEHMRALSKKKDVAAGAHPLLDHGAIVAASMIIGACIGASVGNVSLHVAPATPFPLLFVLVGAWFGIIASGTVLGVLSAIGSASSVAEVGGPDAFELEDVAATSSAEAVEPEESS